MEDDQQAKPAPKAPLSSQPFNFVKFLLGMAAAFFADFILAIIIPFFLFATSGFNIHGPSPEGGPSIYLIVNFTIIAYIAFKSRDAAFGFFGGAILTTLAMWPLLG